MGVLNTAKRSIRKIFGSGSIKKPVVRTGRGAVVFTGAGTVAGASPVGGEPKTPVVTFIPGVVRGGGSGSPTPPPQVITQKALQDAGLTKAQAEVVTRREELRREAIKRKRGFTRAETQRFLGGGKGIRALREARRKGATSKGVRDLFQEAIDREKALREAVIKEAPVSTVEAFERQKGGVASEFFGLGESSEVLREQKQFLRGKKDIGSQAKLGTISFLKAVVDTTSGILDLPETTIKVIKDPKVLLALPFILKQQKKGAIFITKTSPNEAVFSVAGNIVVFKGTSSAIRGLSTLSRAQLTKLSPKFVGKLDTGSIAKIPVGAGKFVNIKVVGSIPKSTIKRQLSLAGKNIDVAISSQQNKLVGLIRRGRVLRKPIPGETSFSQETRRLLRKFDKKIITRNELIKLDNLVKKQGAKGILERSFFASPGKEVRPSRLGILPEEKTGLSDFLVEELTFRRPKPQILVFRNIKVQDFPKNLQGIVRKIKAGKPLTQKESGELIKFQLKQSGKFKPLGFISGEKEITLAPGEIIKRQKVIGRSIIKGKSVPIVEAKVIKAPPEIRKLLNKANRGTITNTEIRKLNRVLKKKTGFNYDLSSRGLKKRFVDVKPSAVSAPSKVLKRFSYKGKFISSSKFKSLSSKQKSKVKIIKFSPFRSPISPRRPIKKISPVPPKSPPTRKFPRIPKAPPRKITLKRTGARVKTLKKPIQTYNVFGKVGKKFVRLNKGALSRQDALSKGAYAVDHTTARTFKVVPAKKTKKVSGVPKVEKAYFNKVKRKLRPYRVKKGVKFQVKPKYIERRKFGIDTGGEKRGLTLAKYRKLRGVPTRPKRKITPKQRKVLLKNLKKARAAKKK